MDDYLNSLIAYIIFEFSETEDKIDRADAIVNTEVLIRVKVSPKFGFILLK